MKFTKEQKEEIYEKYMKRIDEIADDLENKVHFSPKEIICILLHILETDYNKEVEILINLMNNIK